MKHAELVDAIQEWATARKIDNPDRQMVKLMEEVGELAEAYNKDNSSQFFDTLGDIQVVLIILALQTDFDYEKSLQEAYGVIESRKGETVNGTFIKQSDLEVHHDSEL